MAIQNLGAHWSYGARTLSRIVSGFHVICRSDVGLYTLLTEVEDGVLEFVGGSSADRVHGANPCAAGSEHKGGRHPISTTSAVP